MSTDNAHRTTYFFDAETGRVLLAETELPKKKGHLYLVINRENLFFGSFSLDAVKKVGENNLLNIQRHYIPFDDDFMNIVYSREKGQEKKFFFWVGRLALEVESYFYDEIPESLIFKGNPDQVKHYNIFVFERVSGFEIIYFNVENGDFYSLFEKDESRVPDRVIGLARKYALPPEEVRVLTEPAITLPDGLATHCRIDLIAAGDNRCFFMPTFFPVKKKFSNISRDKQVRSIRNIIHLWNRNLTLIAGLLLLSLLVNGGFYLFLKGDHAKIRERFSAIQDVIGETENIEFQLNKIKRRLARFPDHLAFFKAVAEALDKSSFLTGYSLGEDKIIIEGLSKSSLEILEKLRKSPFFEDVKFKTAVTKSNYSQKERFEIDIFLKKDGGVPSVKNMD